MTSLDPPPRFLTVAFHTSFFPSLLMNRIRGHLKPKEERGTKFVAYGLMEIMILLAVSLILIAMGLPAAVSRGSILGWTASGLGMAGIFGLFIFSVCQRIGEREPASYDQFLIGIFFFFVVLGLTSGIFFGRLEHHSSGLRLLEGVGGLIAGYVIGVLAGLWLQYLGFMSKFLDGLALPAIVGMIVVNLVLLIR